MKSTLQLISTLHKEKNEHGGEYYHGRFSPQTLSAFHQKEIEFVLLPFHDVSPGLVALMDSPGESTPELLMFAAVPVGQSERTQKNRGGPADNKKPKGNS